MKYLLYPLVVLMFVVSCVIVILCAGAMGLGYVFTKE